MKYRQFKLRRNNVYKVIWLPDTFTNKKHIRLGDEDGWEVIKTGCVLLDMDHPALKMVPTAVPR